jgi:hypothetical protein
MTATLATRGTAPRMELTTRRSLGYREMRRRGRRARSTWAAGEEGGGGGGGHAELAATVQREREASWGADFSA